MEVSTIASIATSMAQAKVAQEISVAVLKKALDSQASSSAALLEALPQAEKNLPPHLGQSVNTTA